MHKTRKILHNSLLAVVFSNLLGCGYAEWPPKYPGLIDKNSPSFSTHTPPKEKAIEVKQGESVFSLARRYKVPMRSMIDLNGLKPPFSLKAGQILLVPKVGQEYIVKKGDTLFGISRLYKVDPYRIARLNGILPPYKILVGQKIVLIQTSRSDDKSIKSTSTLNKRRKQDPSGTSGNLSLNLGSGGKVQKNPVETRKTADFNLKQGSVKPLKPEPGFIWPVRGKVISPFGAKSKGLRNDGINIRAGRGTPVLAAENGIVAYAGNELRGFGKLLLVKHSGGWITAYAHNEKLLVKRGQVLKRGQKIATVGSSGNVATPQLHFEIRLGRSAKNPKHFIKSKLS